MAVKELPEPEEFKEDKGNEVEHNPYQELEKYGEWLKTQKERRNRQRF